MFGSEDLEKVERSWRHFALYSLEFPKCNAGSSRPSSHLILQRSSKRPCSSWGSSRAMAVSAYMEMTRWPARSAVSRTNSFSSARACARRGGQPGLPPHPSQGSQTQKEIGLPGQQQEDSPPGPVSQPPSLPTRHVRPPPQQRSPRPAQRCLL